MADIYVATTGNDSTGTGSSGNPYATPGKAASVAAAGDTIYLKYGTYTLTTSTPGAGGPVHLVGTLGSPIYLIGYDTTATKTNTDSNRPTISAGSVGSINVIYGDSFGQDLVRNIIVDGNSQTAIMGFVGNNGLTCYNCRAINCTGAGRGFISVYGVSACSAQNCNIGFASCITVVGCLAKSCNGYGFYANTVAHLCIADSCNVGIYVFANNFAGNCTSYGSTTDGFQFDYSRGACPVVNCLSYGNGGYGFNLITQSGEGIIVNCAGGSNTSGNITGSTDTSFQISFITLSANPFYNATAGDFSLNCVAGGGLACRNVGFPGAFPGGLTTGYASIGAVQNLYPNSDLLAAALWTYGNRTTT